MKAWRSMSGRRSLEKRAETAEAGLANAIRLISFLVKRAGGRIEFARPDLAAFPDTIQLHHEENESAGRTVLFVTDSADPKRQS